MSGGGNGLGLCSEKAVGPARRKALRGPDLTPRACDSERQETREGTAPTGAPASPQLCHALRKDWVPLLGQRLQHPGALGGTSESSPRDTPVSVPQEGPIGEETPGGFGTLERKARKKSEWNRAECRAAPWPSRAVPGVRPKSGSRCSHPNLFPPVHSAVVRSRPKGGQSPAVPHWMDGQTPHGP